MKIVALSLTQPWASLMAIGAKKIETRSWSTSYRGLVAIHASKGFPKDAKDLVLHDPDFIRALGHGYIYTLDKLPLGAIIAVGKLVDCKPTEVARLTIGGWERIFGDYSEGRYAWIFEDVRRLPEPIPAKGSLGLWTPQEDVLQRLREFVGEAHGRENT